MKKRSNNTLDSDATKTIAAKPEASTPDYESTKVIEEKAASSTLDTNPKKAINVKTEVKTAASEPAKTISKKSEVKAASDDAKTPEKAKAEVKAQALEPAKTIAVKKEENKLDSESIKIIEAKHHDPFSVLGRHPKNNQILVKVYLPYAETVRFSDNGSHLNRITGTDFFEYYAKEGELPEHYKLLWVDKNGYTHENYDPYDFGPQLPPFDQHLFGEGKHWHIYQKLGGHLHSVDGIDGVFFAVWAPKDRKSVV